MNDLKRKRQYLRDESKKFGAALQEIHCSFSDPRAPRRAWRSRDYLVQFYVESRTGIGRLSINRAEIDSDGNWKDGITWDTLQRLKREAGFGDWQAIEFYPPDRDIVYDHNMRHLFLMEEPLPFAWTAENAVNDRLPDTF